MDNVNEIITYEEMITYTVTHQISEECDRFVLQTICNSIYRDTKIIIPKKLIIRALETFKQEHKKEYEFLIKRAEKDFKD